MQVSKDLSLSYITILDTNPWQLSYLL